MVDLIFFAWGVPVALLTLKVTGHLPKTPWLLAGGLTVSVTFAGLWYLLAFHLAAVPELIERPFRWRSLRRYRGRVKHFTGTLTGTVAQLSATTWSQQLGLQALAAFSTPERFRHVLGDRRRTRALTTGAAADAGDAVFGVRFVTRRPDPRRQRLFRADAAAAVVAGAPRRRRPGGVGVAAAVVLLGIFAGAEFGRRSACQSGWDRIRRALRRLSQILNRSSRRLLEASSRSVFREGANQMVPVTNSVF